MYAFIYVYIHTAVLRPIAGHQLGKPGVRQARLSQGTNEVRTTIT
jgi:hypothetical protein